MGMEIKRAVFAAVLGVLTAVCLSGLFAWMMLKEILALEHMDLASTGVLIAAGGMAALACGRGEGSVKRTAAAETGLVLMLALVNLLLYDGRLNGLLPGAMLIAGTAGAVLLARAGKGKGIYGKYPRKKQPMGKLNKKYRR